MFCFDEQISLMRTWGDFALDCMNATAQLSAAMLGLGNSASSPAKQDQAVGIATLSSAVQGLDRVDRPRRSSWYRAPQRNPFEVTCFGMTLAFPFAPPATAVQVPQPGLGMMQPFYPWTSPLGWPMQVLPWAPGDWLHWPQASWPTTAALPWIAAAMSTGAAAPTLSSATDTPAFATYRSDSGHAVAQITFPNDVVAAVAVPSSTASVFDALFGWPRLPN